MVKTSESTAQLYDQLLNRTTFALFVLALAIGIDCSHYFLADDWQEPLRWIRRGFTLIILVSIVPIMLKLAMRKAFKTGLCGEPESFLVQTYQRACTHGFTFIMLLLVGLQAYLGPETQGLPTEFYIKAVLGLTLLVVSISFFIQTRVDDDVDEDFADMEDGHE